METRNNLISKLKQQLENNPLVIGFVLVGSVAREETDIYHPDKYSDIEAYLIVSDEDVKKVESELLAIVNKLGKVIFSYKNRWSGLSTLFDDLLRLELPIIKQSEINTVFSRPKAQPIKVLIDRTNGTLEHAISNRPESIDLEKLFQDEIDDYWYMSTVACQYYKRGELYNTRSAMHITTSSLVKFLELLNDPKILLLETNKRVEKFLSKEQIQIIAELSPAYGQKKIWSGLVKSFDIFLNTTKEVSEKYGYNYNHEKYIEVKDKLLELIRS